MMALAFVKSHLESKRIMFFVVFAVTLVLVIADATRPNELDMAAVYGLPLVLAGATRSRPLLWILTALLPITTFVVYFLQIPSGGFMLYEPFFLNRMLGVVGLLFIAGLLQLWITSVETSETQVRLINEKNEKLEAAKVSRRLVEVQESERRVLANHLHDLVGQKLTALSINLNIVEGQLSSSQATRIRTRLDVSLQLVEEITESIRDVIAELRPEILDDYGLIPALRWYTNQFTKQTEVATAMREEGAARRLPPPVERALFRIAQEALANVAKYAPAQKAVVTLESMPHSICLTISDDGGGFVPTTDHPPDSNHGWGMMIMRERAAMVDARLSVESAPGHGTQITVRWRG